MKIMQNIIVYFPFAGSIKGTIFGLTRFCIFLFVLIIILPWLMPESSKAEGHPSALTFGSEKVLTSCWSEEELQGKPEDKIIIFERDLLPLPPRLIAPLSTLISSKQAPGNSIRYINPYENKKVMALTFDLCERTDEITGYDYEIVNYLRAHQIRATFFAGGKWMQSHPVKTMQLMADPLFELGNHTWSHANMRVLGREEQRLQILLTQAQYRELYRQLSLWPCVRQAGQKEMAKIPTVPLCFRFPFGACNVEGLQLLKQMNLIAVQWDIVTEDSIKEQTAERITTIVLKHARPGSIIVCHANGRGHQTARALSLFVPELQKRGYSFVTVSELLTYGQAATASECYELRPGDNKRYDKLFGGDVTNSKEPGSATGP
jgi:peptidoglycan/xylan/chitin deacetylase (PgdA/CDA1 family)